MECRNGQGEKDNSPQNVSKNEKPFNKYLSLTSALILFFPSFLSDPPGHFGAGLIPPGQESLITLTWDFGAGSSFALLRIVRVFRLVRIVRLVRTVQVGG